MITDGRGTPAYAQIEFLERKNAELEEKIERLRDQVTVLKATCAAHRDQLDMADIVIKERGERMKAMVWRIMFAKSKMLNSEAEEIMSWFDPETGEPL